VDPLAAAPIAPLTVDIAFFDIPRGADPRIPERSLLSERIGPPGIAALDGARIPSPLPAAWDDSAWFS
jgi:hypothetical protein